MLRVLLLILLREDFPHPPTIRPACLQTGLQTGMLYVCSMHAPCTLCALSLLQGPCTLRANFVNAPCKLRVHSVHAPFTLGAYLVHARCILSARSVHAQCTLRVVSVNSACPLQAHSVHAQCTFLAPSVFQSMCISRQISHYFLMQSKKIF